MDSLTRTALVAVVAAALSSGVLVVAPAEARHARPASHRYVDIDSFMTGLACVESSGRFSAENPITGAYGKYQIMPRIWPAWSSTYLGNRWARPTPRNQEFVARQRITDLWELRHRWRLVAHWWLTGNADPDESLWTPGSSGYVERVMLLARMAANPQLRAALPQRCAPRDLGTPNIRTTPWPRVTVTGGRVHLRLLPGGDQPAVGIVKRGDVLVRLGASKDSRGKQWLRVGLHDGSTAWIASWFTERVPERVTGRAGTS